MTITQRDREHLLTALNALKDAEEALERVMLMFDVVDLEELDSSPFNDAKKLALHARGLVTKYLKLPTREKT